MKHAAPTRALAVAAVLAAGSFLPVSSGSAQEPPAEPYAQEPPAEPHAQEESTAERCHGDRHREFDFWLGGWEVRNAAGDLVGHNEISRVARGCGLLERWQGIRGGRGVSLNTYDADLERWTQRWVGDGATLWLEGGLEKGPQADRMVLSGTEPRTTPRGEVLDRISWTPLPDGRVRQVWEVSSDGGASWREIFVGLYSRVAGNADASLFPGPAPASRPTHLAGGEDQRGHPVRRPPEPAPRGDHVDTQHGVRAPDPYR